MGAVENIITDNLPIWSSAVQSKSSSGRGTSSKRKLYGVKKLRELILDLAVRGLLVPQDPNDESAIVLLENINLEKEQLFKRKAIKNPKSPLLPIGSELPYKVPDSWLFLRFSDSYYTISPSKNKLKISDVLDRGRYPVVDQGQKFVSGYTMRKDLVISIPHPVIIFGDHTRNIKLIDFDFVAGADGTKILSPILINPAYFYNCCLSLRVESRGYGRHFKILNDNLLALPPLSEQQRIVTKVDELMALCDTLEQQQENSIQAHETLAEALLEALTSAADADVFQAAWQRISEHFDVLFTTEHSIDKLKETILQLAVMGKLVPQDPNDEPARDLLKVLQSNKQALIREKKAKDSGNMHPKAPAVPHFAIPHSWLWVRFRELIWCFRGHNPPKSEFLYQPKEGYVRFVQITDFKTNDSAVYVPISPKNKMVYTGEILIAAYRHIGKLSRHMEGAFNVALCKILEYQPMNRDYIELLIGTDAVKGELLRASERGHIPSMHSDHLLSLLVPLPPKEEQHRIVIKVDELMALCDQLKESLQQAQQTQIHLTDAVVENAL
jgi:type I restriction enzyme S subunit